MSKTHTTNRDNQERLVPFSVKKKKKKKEKEKKKKERI